MEPLTLLRKQIIQVLRSDILPWLDEGLLETVILQVPEKESNRGILAVRPSELLRETGAGGTYMRHTHWPEARLISRRFLYMGCVVDGPVDLFVGTSDFQGSGEEADSREVVFRLKHGTCFLVPPRVPFVDGSRPHWEQDDSVAPDSRIFWMEVTPTGILVHLCQTKKGDHQAQSEIFVGDKEAVMLCECLLEELRSPSINSITIAKSLASAILLRLDQSLNTKRCFQPDWKGNALAAAEEGIAERGGTLAVRRACDYIQANQNETLSLEGIAAQCGVSATHLNRLFQTTVGLSVMKYVTQNRLKTAQVLLESTELPVAEVGKTVGFTHAAHFSRVFTQHLEVTPLEFRRQRQGR